MYFGYIFVLFFILNCCESKLTSLFVIHRHADRTPVKSYPKDPHACYWKNGLGKLTERGEQRMKDFGKILRQKYGDFWPEKSNLYVASSRVDRAVRSVQFLLDGIYSDDFLLNPVPIHSKHINEDKMLFPIFDICPKYTHELERVFNYVTEWFNGLSSLWSYLIEKSGEPLHKLNAHDGLQIPLFQDVFLVQREQNLTLPEWMNDTIYDKLHDAARTVEKTLYSTKILQRLPAGLLFKEIRNQMNAIERGNFTKIHIYSTHDLKIIALLMGLNAFNEILPPYGASLIFEFHSNDVMIKDRFIKSYYLNDTSTATFHPLKLSGCHETDGCSFENFNKLINDLIPNDWYAECGLPSPNTS